MDNVYCIMHIVQIVQCKNCSFDKTVQLHYLSTRQTEEGIELAKISIYYWQTNSIDNFPLWL